MLMISPSGAHVSKRGLRAEMVRQTGHVIGQCVVGELDQGFASYAMYEVMVEASTWKCYGMHRRTDMYTTSTDLKYLKSKSR
jgi:hypothetical protein